MILWIGKFILVPALLTWTAWFPYLADYYGWFRALAFLEENRNTCLFVTALLAPYICLIYDTYRGSTRRVQFSVGALFVLMTIISNIFLDFFLQHLLPGLGNDVEVAKRIMDRIINF